MEHSYFRDKISAFKDSGLNTEEQYLISLHLKECAECRALLEKLEAFDSMVSEESKLSSDEYFDKLAGKIDERIAGDPAKVTDISTRNSWAGLTWKITATAASVAFLVFIGYHKDDILPPSSPKTLSESPVIMAPGSTVKVGSIRVKRQDIAEDQSASFSSPKPSPAKLRSQSAVDGYLSDRDAVGKSDDAQGDVRFYDSKQERLEVTLGKVQGKRKTITEQSSIVKESPATEKIFIRGGRANEVNYILEDIPQEAAKDSPMELSQEKTSPKTIDKFETNARVSISQQEMEEETIGESDSNYKRVRKSALASEEVAEDMESIADDSAGQRESKIKKEIYSTSDDWLFSSTFSITAADIVRNLWRTTRDSLLSGWLHFDIQRMMKSAEGNRSDEDEKLSQADRDKALETELLNLLQDIIRVSEDSLETNRAVEIISEIAKFGVTDSRQKAKLYLDSLEAARSKSNEKRK